MVAAQMQRNQAQSVRNNRLTRTRRYCGCGICRCAVGIAAGPSAWRIHRPMHALANRLGTGAMSAPDMPTAARCRALPRSLVDGPVWRLARVCEVFRDPSLIATQVAKHRNGGGRERDLAAVEKRLAGITAKQAKIARAIASVDDNTAEPLYTELTALAESKVGARAGGTGTAHGEGSRRPRPSTCGRLSRLVCDRQPEPRNVDLRRAGGWRSMHWAWRFAFYRLGTEDAEGNPHPRWEMRLNPIAAEDGFLHPQQESLLRGRGCRFSG